MRNLILMCLLLSLTGNSVSAQQKTAGDVHAMWQNDEQLRDCRRTIDADIFPSETCSAILTYLSPADQLGPVSEDGSFIVLSPAPDGKTTNAKTYYLPPKLRSEIALNTIKATLDDVGFVAKDEPSSLIAAMSPQGQDLWFKLRDVYCYYHPKATYTDLSENKQTCVAITHVPDEKTLEGEFNGALIFKVNYLTFLNDRNQAKLERETSTQTNPAQGDQVPHGQSIGSYIHDMGEALVPYGTTSAPTCHKVEIDLIGPWGQRAIPHGLNQQHPDEYDWAILKFDVIHIFLDLATLDEDNVHNKAIFSLEYAANHKRGTPYVPDTPMVSIHSQGLNHDMTLDRIDLDKLKALEGRTDIPESQLGLTVETRPAALILFKDQEHADAFEKAIKKAIVVCKAQ